jgi:protoheme IX farnesyltransferase
MARRMLITQGTTLEVRSMNDDVAIEATPEGHFVAAASRREKVAAYVALTKPRIIELLLITTVPAMIVAERGLPSPWLMLATLIGGTLAAGGANAINCYIDRDIDGVMHRTRKRPLPAHKVAPSAALVFGAVLGVIGFLFLWGTVNLASAVLATSALLFYVFVYTLVLKRSTPQNIVIGGAAGAAPALVGWSAVTGTVDWPALIMFAIIFYWTPPHFWALAMRYEREYARAQVPMMPVVYGRDETSKHIVLYSFLLLAMCLALFSVGRMGLVYLTTAVVLNVVFVAWAVRLWRDPTTRRAWGLFKYSIYYLAVLFVAMAVDQLFYVQV